MQFRIAEGPTSALNIGEVVTPEEVRAAFLALTKQYHPARFGRLSPEIQKLSNEVFLGIKGAHDHMLKALGSSTAASRGGARAGNGVPHAQHGADGTSRTNTPRGTQSIPRIEGTRDGRASSPVIGGQTRSTPPMGVPIQSRPGEPRPATGSMPALARPGESRPTTGSPSRDGQPGQPAQRSSTTGSLPQLPQQRPTGSIPVQRPGTPPPAGASQPIARAVTPVPPGTVPGVGTHPVTRAGTPPSSSGTTQPITPVPPGTQPGVGGSAGSQRMVRVRTATGAMFNVPASQVRNDRQSTPPPSRTMTPLARPSDGISPPTQPPRPTPGIAPPTQPPRADNFNPPTVRNLEPPAGNYGAGTFDEEAAFRDAAALMEQKNWLQARQALHALAAKVPQSRTYRAWLCYARGREAYIAGRPDDAILEMQRALQLEPDLAHAKHALAELQRRR